MNYVEAVATCYSKYATFSGRATRSEYWFFTLFALIISVGAAVIDRGMFQFGEYGGPLGTIITLVNLLPSLAVTARRLHDTGRSGWKYLWIFTLIGAIWVLIWLCKKGDEGSNAYGDPQPA